MQPEEALAYCSTQDTACVFIETSAKKNYRVDDLFYELFVVANLPLEMAPNHHKRVSTAFGSPCTLPPTSSQSSRSKKCTLSIKRRLSDACGVVAPNVRRPSIRTDLMIMRTKTCAKGDNDSASGSPKLNLNRLVRSSGQTDKRSCTIQWYSKPFKLTSKYGLKFVLRCILRVLKYGSSKSLVNFSNRF